MEPEIPRELAQKVLCLVASHVPAGIPIPVIDRLFQAAALTLARLDALIEPSAVQSVCIKRGHTAGSQWPCLNSGATIHLCRF